MIIFSLIWVILSTRPPCFKLYVAMCYDFVRTLIRASIQAAIENVQFLFVIITEELLNCRIV